MNTFDFGTIVDDVRDSIRALTKSKGVEYRAGDDDQLANFKRLSTNLQLPMEKVLLVYLQKHLDSITNYANGCPPRSDTSHNPPMSEPIDSRVDDAILYLVLLRAMVAERTAEREAQDDVKKAESYKYGPRCAGT